MAASIAQVCISLLDRSGQTISLAALANPGVETLVVRGISDLIDQKGKADASGSQAVAAHHAAAFAGSRAIQGTSFH